MPDLPRLQFCAGVNPNLPVSHEIVKTALALAKAKQAEPRPEPTPEQREQMAIRRGHRRTALLAMTRRLAARGLAQSAEAAAAAAAATATETAADAPPVASERTENGDGGEGHSDDGVEVEGDDDNDDDESDPCSDEDIDAVLDMARAVIDEGVHRMAQRQCGGGGKGDDGNVPTLGPRSLGLPPWLRESERAYLDMLKTDADVCPDPDLRPSLSSAASSEPCSGVVVRRILQAPGDQVPIQLVPGDGDATKNFENCRRFIEKQPKSCNATLVRGYRLTESDWPGSGGEDGRSAHTPAFFMKGTFHCVVRVTKMDANTQKACDSYVCTTSAPLDAKTGTFDDGPFIYVPSSRAHAELTDAELLSSRWSTGVVVIGESDQQSETIANDFQYTSTVLAENFGLASTDPQPIASRESVVRMLIDAVRKRESDQRYDSVFERKLQELESRGAEPVGMTPESIKAVPNLTVLLHPLFDAWHEHRRFKVPNWKLAAQMGFPTVSRVREFVVTRLIEYLIDKIRESHSKRERPGCTAELHETMRWLDRQVDEMIGMMTKKVEMEDLWSGPYSDKKTMPAYRHTLALYIANTMGFDDKFCREQAFGVLDALYKTKIGDLPKQRRKERSSSHA
jgi:hypothetical protein